MCRLFQKYQFECIFEIHMLRNDATSLCSVRIKQDFHIPPTMSNTRLSLPPLVIRHTNLAFMEIYYMAPYDHVQSTFQELLKNFNISDQDACCIYSPHAPYIVTSPPAASTCTLSIKTSDNVETAQLRLLMTCFHAAMQQWVIQDPEHPGYSNQQGEHRFLI